MPNRKPNRLQGYDYSSPGYYFVTICTKDRFPWFGEIYNSAMILNESGSFINQTWKNIPNYYNNVYIDKYVIMPNHIHGIIHIQYNPANRPVGVGHCPTPTGRPPTGHYGLLSKIINGFKNTVTKHIRKNMGIVSFQWQRSFYDRIIRSQNELYIVRKYIRNNPARWDKDERYGDELMQ